MDSTKAATGADLAVDFNRVNLALAKRQRMLASLMGLSSADHQSHSHVSEEASDDFTAEPELLGIGAKKQDDGEDAAQILSSELRLKRQLLPKSFDKQRSANRQPDKGLKAVTSPDTTMKGGTPFVVSPRRDDSDSDEDAGRTSLGKRKREKVKQVDKHVKEDGKADVMDEEAGNVMRPEDKLGSMHQVNETGADNTPSKRMDKRRRKKSKKKRRQAQEEIPAS